MKTRSKTDPDKGGVQQPEGEAPPGPKKEGASSNLEPGRTEEGSTLGVHQLDYRPVRRRGWLAWKQSSPDCRDLGDQTSAPKQFLDGRAQRENRCHLFLPANHGQAQRSEIRPTGPCPERSVEQRVLDRGRYYCKGMYHPGGPTG